MPGGEDFGNGAGFTMLANAQNYAFIAPFHVSPSSSKAHHAQAFGVFGPVFTHLHKKKEMHAALHVCYEVADILAARDHLLLGGARLLGDGNPTIGAHGKPVLFLHPKDFCGTLIELEEA